MTRRTRGAAAWALPSVALALVPKCPMCVAAYLAIGGGLGVSLTTAAHLRTALVWLCWSTLALLAARLVARRTPMDEARKLIEGFLASAGPAKQARATALFAELYSILDAQRSEVMNGIERFSHKEKAMAEDIRAKTRKLQQLQDVANRNQAEIDDLANQLAWETRIFEDRRKSTSYVCEVPVLIEKRLFDLGRAIQDAANVNPGAN